MSTSRKRKTDGYDQSLSGTLRRRATMLERDGYAPDWFLPLLNAADRLQVLERVLATADKGDIIDGLISDNRRMRKAIASIVDIIDQTRSVLPAERQRLQIKLVQTLTATAEFGGEVRMCAFNLGTAEQPRERADVEAQVGRLLDRFYNEEVPNGEDSKETAHEAGAADGGTAAEQPSAAEGDRGAEG